MVKIMLYNKTKRVVLIKEGNGGIFRAVATLKIDGKFNLTIDPNATYREFVVCVKLVPNREQVELVPNREQLELSSEDLADFKRVDLLFNEGSGRLYYSATRRRDGTIVAGGQGAPRVASEGGGSSQMVTEPENLYSRLVNLFSKKNSSSATPQPSVTPHPPT